MTIEQGEVMRGPARAGGVIYAKDLARVTHFYCQVLGMVIQHQDAKHAVIRSEDIQLVIHDIPAPVATEVIITSPPQQRTLTALKFFFTVSSIDAAAATARTHGGDVHGYSWNGPGFRARDGHDCEGNVFQLRESLEDA
jgi:catechol 2,3-dioxygenase-like lactoylglutathione lyase family enzyme